MNPRDPELLFKYIIERESGLRGKTIFLKLRRIMLYRALRLVIALPLDLCILFTRFLTAPWQSPVKTITLTRMFPDLLAQLSGKNMVYAGPAPWAVFAWRQKATYMPVSVPYILLTLALYMPKNARKVLGNWALCWVGWLYKLYKATNTQLLVHSDALPFARAFVLEARNCGIKTVCIQHGIFHSNSGINNIDGYLCDFNVVRSKEDSEIIKSSSKNTIFCIEPDFFLTTIKKNIMKNEKSTITLVGEGWFAVDEDFSKKYLNKLQLLESELIRLGFHVLFRPHPSERSFVKKMGFQEIDLSELAVSMSKTDIYLGFSSTLLIEAAAVGLSAAQISVDGIFNPGMSRAGIQIVKVESTNEVIELIKIARSQIVRPDWHQTKKKKEAVLRVCQEIERIRT